MRSNKMKLIATLCILAMVIVACGSSPENENLNIDENTNNAENGEETQLNILGESIENNEDATIENAPAGSTIDPEFVAPLMDDATDLYSLSEVVDSYQPSHSIDEISAFYDSEMEKLGYTKGYEILVADKLIMRFDKGTYNIVLSTSANGSDGFFVSIGPQDE